MALNSAERELLLELFRNRDGIDVYRLHQRYMLSPGQLAEALAAFGERGLVEYLNRRARLTDKGREWLLAGRKEMFFSSDTPTWKATVCAADTDPNYAPKPAKMISRFFWGKRRIGAGS